MGIAEYLEDTGASVPWGSGWRKLRCPFHSDARPSATINRDAGRFYCFVCNINEDLIGLIMLREGVGYAEAKRKAEEDFGAGDSPLSGVDSDSDYLPSRPRPLRRNNPSRTSWRRGFA